MERVTDSGVLGNRIRKERKSQDITQEELAALAGVGVRFVRELEQGKQSCQIGLALTVMKTLGLSFYIEGRGESPP